MSGFEGFENMKNGELIDAFEVVLQSPEHLKWGFDYVDNEKFEDVIKKLSSYHRKQIGEIYDVSGNTTVKKLYDLFTEDDGLRIGMWREVFKRMNRIDKEMFLEENEQYYLETLKYVKEEEYDWSEFTCILEEENKLSKLRQIKSGWNELGMQVYDCSINNNGKMCHCLRQASNTTAYRCFRGYLEDNKKSPTDKVPDRMLLG